MKTNKSLIGTSILAAITASLCCITPVLALLAGTSGIASTFSWVEPFRPYLIGLTILVLVIAWSQQLRSKSTVQQDCVCEDDEKPSFWHSRKFLTLVTVFSLVMLAFPYYSDFFYPKNESNSILAMTDKNKEITIDVRGMTCSGCEAHIEHAVGQLEGVSSVKASYDSGTATVLFSTALVSTNNIVNAIKETGYEVIDNTVDSAIGTKNGNINFYKVPLVCNAAPTIGCGSRAKPVLLNLQKIPEINEVKLNRSGTTIAVAWEDGTNSTLGQPIVDDIFKKHQLATQLLLGDDYLTALSSFDQKEIWLKGSEVDQLSREEASFIADQIVEAVKKKTNLTPENEKRLHKKATDTFFELFLNFEELKDLGDPKIYQSKLSDIWSYGENLLGKGKMPNVGELWESCSNAAKSCDHKGCSSSCKTPNS